MESPVESAYSVLGPDESNDVGPESSVIPPELPAKQSNVSDTCDLLATSITISIAMYKVFEVNQRLLLEMYHFQYCPSLVQIVCPVAILLNSHIGTVLLNHMHVLTH